jgi:hypothetical protein
MSAESTNASGRLDFSSFRIVSERNIFNPNRASRSGRAAAEKAVKTESFSLVGTLRSEKDDFAFFDGSSSQYRKVLQANQSIAGYKIAEIAHNEVKLVSSNQQLRLAVGIAMKRQDEGEWKPGSRPASGEQARAAGSSEEKVEPSSSSEENEVLKRLRQRRDQEEKK